MNVLPGRTGDEEVGHLGQIGNDRIPNILPRLTGTLLAAFLNSFVSRDIAQVDTCTCFIRYFDAHGSLSGNRCFNKDLCCR